MNNQLDLSSYKSATSYLRNNPSEVTIENLLAINKTFPSMYGPIGEFFNNFNLNISNFPPRFILSLIQNAQVDEKRFEYLLRCRLIELSILKILSSFPRIANYIELNHYLYITETFDSPIDSLITPLLEFKPILQSYITNVVHLDYDYSTARFIRPRKFKFSETEEDSYDEDFMMEVISFIITLYQYLRSIPISHEELCK